MNDPPFATFSLPRAKPPEPKDLCNVTILKMDERIKAEVVTQYTITDGRTYTDALDAAKSQARLDLSEIGTAWLDDNDCTMTTGVDFADCCEKHGTRLMNALQRLADAQAATPVPLAPLPRPGRKR